MATPTKAAIQRTICMTASISGAVGGGAWKRTIAPISPPAPPPPPANSAAPIWTTITARMITTTMAHPSPVGGWRSASRLTERTRAVRRTRTMPVGWTARTDDAIDGAAPAVASTPPGAASRRWRTRTDHGRPSPVQPMTSWAAMPWGAPAGGGGDPARSAPGLAIEDQQRVERLAAGGAALQVQVRSRGHPGVAGEPSGWPRRTV